VLLVIILIVGKIWLRINTKKAWIEADLLLLASPRVVHVDKVTRSQSKSVNADAWKG